MDGWQTKRCAGVEAALTDAALAPHTLVAALEALLADTQPEPTKQEFVNAAAQGILLEALAPLVQQVRALPGGNKDPGECVWTCTLGLCVASQHRFQAAPWHSF